MNSSRHSRIQPGDHQCACHPGGMRRAIDDVMHDGKEYYLFDAGLAVENMVLAATDLGLVTDLMTAFDEAQVKQILHIPEDVRAVVATPLAYPLEPSYDEAARNGCPCARART